MRCEAADDDCVRLLTPNNERRPFSFVFRPFCSVCLCILWPVQNYGLFAPACARLFFCHSRSLARRLNKRGCRQGVAATDVRRHLNVITSMFIHNLRSLQSNPCYHLPTHCRSPSPSVARFMCMCAFLYRISCTFSATESFERGPHTTKRATGYASNQSTESYSRICARQIQLVPTARNTR